MNGVLILVIGILAVMTFLGFKKGLIKMVLSMISLIVTIIAVSIVTPIISDLIKDNTSVMATIEAAVDESLEIDDEVLDNVQLDVIDNLEIPDVIKNLIKDNETIEKYKEMGIESFNTYVVKLVANTIFNVIVFVVSFIIVFIAVRIVFAAINLISKLPVIHQVNTLAGTVVGFVEGVIIVWIFFAVVTMFGSTEFGMDVFAQINGNAFLSFVYNNNLIMKYLVNII